MFQMMFQASVLLIVHLFSNVSSNVQQHVFGLSFAHTLGEFGVVLMIGGNIPGETRVVSIALFDHVEALDYASAHQLAFVLLIFSLVLLSLLYRVNGRRGSSWT